MSAVAVGVGPVRLRGPRPPTPEGRRLGSVREGGRPRRTDELNSEFDKDTGRSHRGMARAGLGPDTSGPKETWATAVR